MKKLFLVAVALSAIYIISCRKTNHSSSGNLSLIQHKWMVVSINGEALRYLGTADDYYNFGTDGILYRYVGKNYDSSAYTLLSDNRSLLLYPIVNGIKSSTASDYNIVILSNAQFVITSSVTMFHTLDSLKR